MNTAETVTAPRPETTAPPTAADAPTDAAAPASAPGRSIVRPAMRGVWWATTSDTPALVPWRWMAYTDTAAAITRATTPNVGYAAVTAAGISAAVAGLAAWRTSEKRLTGRIKTGKSRQKLRNNAKAAVVAGTAWMLTASMWTPAGPHGIMQLTLLGGGLAVAAPYLWRNRSRDTGVPVAAIEAPKDDQRLAKFRDHFCDHGPLTDARIHDLTYVPGGFQFHIELLLAHRGTFRDVKRLEDEIAALYDVPLDHVSVEPPESRSARRAVVTVLTATKAHQRDEAWDGVSTYDPTTGCFTPGRYADGTPSHWQMHVPYSGACSGAIVGVQGSGKTGTLHVVAAESGKAKLCTRCLGEQSCNVCDVRRICALWMGDPQSQPFSVWRGRADVTAMGPVAVVRMLSWLHAGMRYRADQLGRLEWVDHQGRTNYGKGWFDPTPDEQIHLGVIDEWPIVAADPELGPIAVSLALDILREGRKVGYGLVFGSQEADVDVLGDRGVRNLLAAFNACVHRTDSLAKRMLGIDGNPEDLPDGIHGISYLKSLDRRSDIVHRTKHLPENLRPGQTGIDVRDIADQIAADPIQFDEAVLRAIRPLGYTGPGQVLTDDDDWDVNALYGGTAAQEKPAADPIDPPAVVTAPAVAPPTQQAISAVREALGQATDADVFDLMHSTGLSALDVSRALDALITVGHATQAPTGRYAHA